MARLKRDSLLYFPLDVDFFRNKKIRALKARFGTKGITLYIYILCLIYGDKGYYAEVDDYFFDRVTDDTGISERITRQIMSYLCERSMLDDKLFVSVKILTSAAIQQTYQEAKKGLKRDIKVNADYWLLNQEETLSFIKVTHFEGFSWNNDNYSKKNGYYSENNSQSKEKKIKVNENKENNAAVVGVQHEKELERITELYQENIEPLKPIVKDNIIEWLDKVEADVIVYAIQEAVKHGVSTWKYINAILDIHFNAGRTSLEQIESEQRAYSKNSHNLNVYEDNTGFDYDSIEQIMQAKYDK